MTCINFYDEDIDELPELPKEWLQVDEINEQYNNTKKEYPYISHFKKSCSAPDLQRIEIITIQ
ncbi:hypothetical protein N9C10_04410 [Flavobacteriaceae bacterium]|nr:hypothetical protein [Flavobacteriaceae bacterium]